MFVFCVSLAELKSFRKHNFSCWGQFQKPLRMRQLSFSVSSLFPIIIVSLANFVSAGYNVGVGRADITGPAAEVFCAFSLLALEF